MESANKNASQQSSTTTSEINPSEDLVHYLKEYARADPQKAALWCVGVGFVLGWKLKPW